MSYTEEQRRRWQLEADLENERVRRLVALDDALGVVLALDAPILSPAHAHVLEGARAAVRDLRRTW